MVEITLFNISILRNLLKKEEKTFRAAQNERNGFGMWQVLCHVTYTLKLNQLLFSCRILKFRCLKRRSGETEEHIFVPVILYLFYK